MTEEQISKFEAFAQKCMDADNAVGMAVAVVDREGKTRYEKMFGLGDQERGAVIDENTIFGLASVTKSFTCLAIMQLAEQGILKIDDPVSKYIPEFTGSNQSAPVLIKHLMRHSGGYFPMSRILISDVAQDMGLDEAVVGDFAFNAALAQEGCRLVANRMDAQTNLLGAPGQYFSYFNDGYALLSDIIYRHGDCDSFAAYLDKHILKPLGMTRSGCDFVKPFKDPNHAALYVVEDGELRNTDYHEEAFVLNGGGAMKSTLKDMKKYVAMYLSHGKGLDGTQVATAETIAAMTSPQQAYNYVTDYGYGLNIKHLNGKTVVGHSGSLPGVSSNMLWCDEAGLGVIVLCNTMDVASEAIGEAAMNLALGFEPVNARYNFEACPWSENLMTAACGEYASTEGNRARLFLQDGQLMLESGSKAYPVIPISPSCGMVKKAISDMFIECIQDEARGVYGLRCGSRILPRVD
ncbi:MAG: serine hydrolase domain-containing protein [Eubacterium sp.]|nr:serine hydrolase domain-containing protein [Eubacterium sp.]